MYGLIEVISSTGDDIAVIKLILPSPAPADFKWYKFTKTGEWIDFSRDVISNSVGDGAEFNDDRSRVTLFITDNGPYDAADAQAGIVRDPSGLGMPASAPPPGVDNVDNNDVGTTPPATGGSGGGGGGCFITTSAR